MNCLLFAIVSTWLGTACLLSGQSYNDYDQSPHDYWVAELEDPMSDLLKRVSEGETNLDEKPGITLVRRLLKELNILESSQILVFSRTSLQSCLLYTSPSPRD